MHRCTKFSATRRSGTFCHEGLTTNRGKLSVTFSLPARHNCSTSGPHIVNSINGTNMSIYSVLSVGVLFTNVPLSRVSMSVAVGNTILPVLTFFVDTNVRRNMSGGVLTNAVRGSVLGRFVIHGACVCPPTVSVHVVNSVFRCAAGCVPGFGDVSVSNCRVRRYNTAYSLRVNCALTSNVRCVHYNRGTNLPISTFTGHLSFF